MAMYVSVHSTTHPVEGAAFLSLERQAFSNEYRTLGERQASYLAQRPPDEVPAQFASWTIGAAIPTAVVDASPAAIDFSV